jgi:hypothetical protein
MLARLAARLPEATRARLDALLEREASEPEEAEESEQDADPPAARPRVIRWRDLKASPGAVGLESVLGETDNLHIFDAPAKAKGIERDDQGGVARPLCSFQQACIEIRVFAPVQLKRCCHLFPPFFFLRRDTQRLSRHLSVHGQYR